MGVFDDIGDVIGGVAEDLGITEIKDMAGDATDDVVEVLRDALRGLLED